MDETDEEYDDQTSDALDCDEDNWEPHSDEHGCYECAEQECEDIDQHLCEGMSSTLLFSTSKMLLMSFDRPELLVFSIQWSFLHRQLMWPSRSDRNTERRALRWEVLSWKINFLISCKSKGLVARSRPNLRPRAAFERIEKEGPRERATDTELDPRKRKCFICGV